MRRAVSETDTARQFLTRRACPKGQFTFELDTKGGRRSRSAAAGRRMRRRVSPRTESLLRAKNTVQVPAFFKGARLARAVPDERQPCESQDQKIFHGRH
jgi:hypothetical protein